MKKLLFFLPVIAILFASCNVENTEKAVEYNDNMIAIQIKVDDAIVEFIDAIDTYEIETMEEAKANSIKKIEEAVKAIDETRDFDKKDDYKNAMKDLMKMYKGIVDEELSEVIEILSSPEELTDEEIDRYYDMFDDALAKYDDAMAKFNSFQKEFAEKWNFEVKKD